MFGWFLNPPLERHSSFVCQENDVVGVCCFSFSFRASSLVNCLNLVTRGYDGMKLLNSKVTFSNHSCVVCIVQIKPILLAFLIAKILTVAKKIGNGMMIPTLLASFKSVLCEMTSSLQLAHSRPTLSIWGVAFKKRVGDFFWGDCQYIKLYIKLIAAMKYCAISVKFK